MWRHLWVFVREDGKQLDRDALSWRTGVVFRDAGFPHLEDSCVMRHTFASIMDHKGAEHRIIADMMGHKNVPHVPMDLPAPAEPGRHRDRRADEQHLG